MRQNYLNDTEFLQLLDRYNNKKFYARIIVTDQNNNSLESIEGIVTGGSVNIDGKSTVRRTCSLSLTAMEEDKKTSITDAYWSLKNRFKLEIGVNNNIDSKYPDIIWFKQGVFVINSFNKTYNANGSVNITISGQDKMALLNGTLGGNFLSEVDLGAEDTIDEWNNITTKKLSIKTIIKNLMLVFAKERPENIIINDIDDYGWELWEYRGNKPMYLIYQPHSSGSSVLSGEVINFTIDENFEVTLSNNKKRKISKLSQYYSLNTLKPEYNSNSTTIKYKLNDNNFINCKVIKIEYGETAGYHKIDLTYNSDLILKAGETITSALDKIKNMLVNFEYFYDIDGRFVFQKKKERLQEFLISNSSEMIAPTASTESYSYKFDDLSLITNLSPAFKIDNIKNDFTIWGTKNGSLPFHIRYAIDKKPSYYKTQPYYEKRKMTYLRLTNYTGGKCYIQDDDIDKYIESYETVYSKNIKSELTRYYRWVADEQDGILVAKKYQDGEINTGISAPEIQLSTGNYKVEVQLCNINGQLVDIKNNYVFAPQKITYEDALKLLKFNILGTKKVSHGSIKIETICENYSFNEISTLNMGSKYLTIRIKMVIPDQTIFDTKKIKGKTKYEIVEEFLNKTLYFRLVFYPQKQKYNITEVKSSSIANDKRLYYVRNGEYIKWNAYDEKEEDYNNLKVGECKFKHKSQIFQTPNVPWQEIIYQMAKDYYRHNEEDNFLYKLQEANKIKQSDNKTYTRLYMYGKTGYEQYYQDIQGFWRLLYNPEASTNQYGSVLYEYYDANSGKRSHWNKNVYNNSDILPFWIEFLEFGDEAEFSKYSVNNIGQRTKVLNDSKITSILYKEIPEVQFVFQENEIVNNTAYNPVIISSEMKNMFVRSGQGVSAIEKINDLLNEHAYYSSSLSFSTLPIWYLQPNTKIYVKGQGDCMVQGISFSLSHNATMNLTCVKILDSYA